MVKNKGNNKGHDNLIPIKKGECLNPNGRPKGQRNYSTLYRLAMEKIAQAEGMSVDDFEIKFVQQALRKGFNGDTRLYTDTLDRIHGKAMQRTELTGKDGGAIEINKVSEMSDTELLALAGDKKTDG